eukprot:421313-Rhodomonas_salina.1
MVLPDGEVGQQVMTAMTLCACYAKSGTERAYGVVPEYRELSTVADYRPHLGIASCLSTCACATQCPVLASNAARRMEGSDPGGQDSGVPWQGERERE